MFIWSIPRPVLKFFITGSISHWYQYIWLSAQYWWVGNILAAYWYIPFIMIFFVLSPIFIKQIQLPIKIQVSLFLILLCISTLIHRPLDNFPHLHSVIYFMPVYMLGIICSIKREQVFKFLVGKGFVLGIAVVLMSMAQILLYDHYGNFHRNLLLSYDGIDMMLLQKILMCFFLLSVLQKFEHKDLPFLKYIASASFAIYFIHPWVLYFFEYLSDFGHLNIFIGQLGFVVATPVVLAISLVMAATFKKAFPNKSPFIVGW
ncbi:hypothetical protein VZ94_12335 [Methylocucumis oryzae]|uniref:Acyltransferase 3 domain-containing protein n=1 Tax=Methylocucumis oryzae TaxID=1632867 RepID=A0A0F3II17_9GAMM|nr:hypothetical protein VZ94_12335 [Methylocucumis oryzae]